MSKVVQQCEARQTMIRSHIDTARSVTLYRDQGSPCWTTVQDTRFSSSIHSEEHPKEHPEQWSTPIRHGYEEYRPIRLKRNYNSTETALSFSPSTSQEHALSVSTVSTVSTTNAATTTTSSSSSSSSSTTRVSFSAGNVTLAITPTATDNGEGTSTVSTSTSTIVGSVVGTIAGVSLVAVAVILVLGHYKRRKGPRTRLTEEPEMDDGFNSNYKDNNQSHDPHQALLTHQYSDQYTHQQTHQYTNQYSAPPRRPQSPVRSRFIETGSL